MLELEFELAVTQFELAFELAPEQFELDFPIDRIRQNPIYSRILTIS